MPHLSLEYSSNVRSLVEGSDLCRKLGQTLARFQVDGRSVYAIGGVRVRAYCASEYFIADGSPDAGFVHATLQVGVGRAEDVLQATGDALFEVIEGHFMAALSSRGLALSLAIQEFSEAGTWKRNNLHARFRKP